jgi:hypothetical protein
MFHELCGNSTLHNVAIVTNMWGEVTQEVGEAREYELATEENVVYIQSTLSYPIPEKTHNLL